MGNALRDRDISLRLVSDLSHRSRFFLVRRLGSLHDESLEHVDRIAVWKKLDRLARFRLS